MKSDIKLLNVYEKYVNGDFLTDEEIKVGISKLKVLCELMGEMGNYMRMSWKECNSVLMSLEAIKKARKEK